jgi:hypothetical protein
LPARFTYGYDVGDNWRHDVEVLGSGSRNPAACTGKVAARRRTERSGYTDLLEVLADPEHPDCG